MRTVPSTRARGFVIPAGTTMPTAHPYPVGNAGKAHADLTRRTPDPWRRDDRQAVPVHILGRKADR